MGRPQETFNKKEQEKKRLKKKKEKEQKKEERKANSGKGKSMEDMLAYVDEYGNIVSTPPDPNKRKEIKSEDIQISISRQEDMDPADLIRKGTVTFFNDSKGFGFIKDHDSQESIFVHVNGLEEAIAENDKVTFETEKGPKGLYAVRVKILKPTAEKP
jgi:cold shock CspA family protein